MSITYDFIPVLPVEEYLNWAKEQDERTLHINTAMWTKVHIKLLRELHTKKMEYMLSLGEDVEDFSVFCKMSYIVHAYHKVLDQMVREEIEEIISEISK